MTMSATESQYLSRVSPGQIPAITKAGIVNTAPAATDSPIEPTVLAMFSSSKEPFMSRSRAIPITAAGYVAAIVMPAFKPR